MAARLAGLGLAAALFAAPLAWAAGEDSGYEWMTDHGDGDAWLVYGSPETGEDYIFSLICPGNAKATGMTVYVDIAGTKVGDPVVIAFSAGSAKLSIRGKIATDAMSGFLFAEAAGFKIKPVIAALRGTGPVTVNTGDVVTTLPEAGRGKAVGEFAKSCALD